MGRIWLTPALLLAGLLGSPAASADEPELGAMIIDPLTAEDIASLSQSGLDSARFVLSWDQVRNRHGEPLDWSHSDRQVGGLAAAGIRPLPVLFGSGPFRVAGDKVTPPVEKRARGAWKSFVAAAVERYGRGGAYWQGFDSGDSFAPTAWEVWNEPNAVGFWPPQPDPRAYARLLHASAVQIRAADPGAAVVLGGMFGAPTHPRSIRATRFLRAVYRIRGAERDFDEVGIHPYAPGVPRLRDLLEATRRAIVRAGDRGTAIRVTEFGWGSRPATQPNWLPYTRDPAGQAKLLERSVRLMVRRAAELELTAAHWFAWRDPLSQTICPFCSSAGLLENDHAPKPSFFVLQGLAGG